MLFFPLYFVFAMLYVCLILIAVMNNNMLVYWVLMECSVVFFLPFIMVSKYGLESSLKYFLVQVINSFFFLMSLLLSFKGFEIFLLIFLMYKVGSAPFYHWVIYMVRSMNWINMYFLLSIMKIIPMILMMNILFKNKEVYFFILLSCFVGSLGGLGQISLRILMVYSSINHLSWLFSCMILNNMLFFNYMLIYFTILFGAFFFFFFFKLDYISQMNSLSKLNFIVIMNLLNLSGLPPFSVFLIKFIVLKFLFISNMKFLIFFLLLSSLFSLFYYIRLSIYMFMCVKYINFFYSNNLYMSFFFFNFLSGAGIFFIV